MKKMIFLATILLGLSVGCRKVQHLADINVDIPYSTQVNVPSIPNDTALTRLSGVIDFPAIGIETNSKEYLAQYHTSSSKIVKVDLKKLSVQILTPPTQNFDFLDTIQLYLSAAGQPEMLVAYQYVIPKGATTLDFFTVTDVNLKNYFLADTMYFRMRARINTVPEGGTKLNIASVFHMLANPLD